MLTFDFMEGKKYTLDDDILHKVRFMEILAIRRYLRNKSISVSKL